MISRSGDRVPAGDSGQAGRGTPGELPRLSPLLRFAAAVYTVLAAVTIGIGIALAPWGLLLILLAIGFAAAAAVAFIVAAGVERIEADA